MSELSVIILAAGNSTRMKSDLPKLLQPVAGKPILQRVIEATLPLKPEQIFVVYGDKLQPFIPHYQWPVTWIYQQQQLGTAHAAMQALPGIPDHHRVLILLGDAPLLSSTLLTQLLTETAEPQLGFITAVMDNPLGLGRVLRSATNKVLGIVEEKDATPAQKNINEINSGIFVASAKLLKHWLAQVKKQNAAGEYYLPDIIPLALQDQHAVHTVKADLPELVAGVNTFAELAQLERYYFLQRAAQLMQQGVRLMDPARFDLRGELTAGRNVLIDINVVIEGIVHIGDNCVIEPNVILRDTRLAAGCRIKANSVLEKSQIGENCEIGPFARLRPGTTLSAQVHIGNFVEVKNSQLGVGTKASHLSYLGDAVIGAQVNIGAGTITCNYDGVAKHQTIIEDHASIGANANLVAPVTIGAGATIGAGSTITENAPREQLTLARARQQTIADWKKSRN